MTLQDVKNYLQSLETPPQLIRRGKLYTASDLDELQNLYDQCPQKAVFFRLLETKTDDPFIIEKTCRSPKDSQKKRSHLRDHEGCGRTKVCIVGRGEIEDYIRGKGYECDVCHEEKSVLHQKRNEEWEAIKSRDTMDYINTICNPEMIWNEGTKLSAMWSEINGNVYLESVATHLKDLDYKDFLKTPYWKAVAQKVRARAKWRCQICDEKTSLDVHHRNYACHGQEHLYLNELIAICRPCHERHHGKGV